MAFQAKKLRVALPRGEDTRYLRPAAIAMDLDEVSDEAANCFSAAHVIVTAGHPNWCWSDTCVDVWSDPAEVRPVMVSADRLPALREALEDQLREIHAAEQEYTRRLGGA